MRFPNAKIIQFAKAPILGEVKTRMLPNLSAEMALELHRRLVNHTLQRLISAELSPVELWVSEQSHYFEQLTAEHICTTKIQRGRDLGERMFNALAVALDESECALIVGSDCAVLESEYLAQALELLASGVPVVIGPARDGGYVLIGMRRSLSRVFEDIEWGSSNVLAQTRLRCEEVGAQWHELPTLWDIDRYQDLQELQRIVAESPCDYAAFKSFCF